MKPSDINYKKAFENFSFGSSTTSKSASPTSTSTSSDSPQDFLETYESYEEAFSYANMNKKDKRIEHGNFMSLKEKKTDYIKFGYVGDEKQFKHREPHEEDVGWKIHVSIDRTQLEEAWEALLPIFIDHKIGEVKALQQDKEGQLGKEMTIYAFIEPLDTDWQELLTEITQALADANIRPIPKPDLNEQINTSHYLSYCNDDDGHGRYVPAASRQRTDNTREDNPFRTVNVNVNVPNQLPVATEQASQVKYS